MKRRTFLHAAAVTASAAALKDITLARPAHAPAANTPLVISTWNFGVPANETAAETLAKGGSLLDAVEAGIKIVESDPHTTSVGRGGRPDRDGHLTLDACIMDEKGRAGSVVFLEDIAHPISVARMVMEKTPHVMLAGDGAQQFALENGFRRERLLTDEMKKAWEEWLKSSGYTPPVNRDNHDTVGMLVMDAAGNLAGGCSTSGAAWKLHGRVGDSPLIGAGLYVDNEIGAATATGLGEAVIKAAGSFLVVELMRQGASPADACRGAIERILAKQPQYAAINDFLVGFIAVNKRGEIGALSYKKGFEYSLWRDGKLAVVPAPCMVG